MNCQIIVCTVNHPSRIYYPENKKPRVATLKYDSFLQQVEEQLNFTNQKNTVSGRYEKTNMVN